MTDSLWWQHGIVYQIYPRSFQDSNGDGVGDLRGIRRRLDYLSWLGVDAVWLSPIFPSPMADFGYDISNYCDIDPVFGSLADFDQLVGDAHARGLKVILDFVPNHTSDQHPWFLESRSSRSNARRDWYIWRDGSAGGEPPNNWVSQFGGPAWSFDAATRQYYLHSFLRQQPDLNWRNPAVRSAMHDVLRFWLARDVDGFRVDVLWLLIKDAGLRDNPPNPGYQPTQAALNRFLSVHNADQPEIHQVIAEMRAVIDRFHERVLIGEIYLPLERLVAYYGENLSGAHLPFNFQLIQTAWTAKEIARLVAEYESAVPPGGWPNWVLGNHDQPRIAARVGAEQARIAAMLLLTLRGTPTLYYGDELGMDRVQIPASAMQDPWETNEPGLGLSRDPSRTPFHWDGSVHAGFATEPPWLPLDPNFPTRNVETLRREPTSILGLYRRLIEIRRAHPALSIGAFRLMATIDDVLVYERQHAGERIAIALNLGHRQRNVPSTVGFEGAEMLVSSHMDRAGPTTSLTLRPNEGVIVRLK